MEKLETKVKHSIRKAKIKNSIIALCAATGALGVGLVMPGVFKILKYTKIRPEDLFNKKQAIRNSISRLKKHGLLKQESKNGKYFLILTQKGREYFLKIQKAEKKRKQKWDKKWRVVVFDIEEKYRSIRVKVRKELLSYGFFKLQNSVWIYPYPCEDYITLLKTDNKTSKHLIYMVVDEIEQEKDLKEFFGL